MIEPGQPCPDLRSPRRPVVERARPEAACKATREDDRRDPRPARLGCEDEQKADPEGDIEPELVEDSAEPRLRAW